MSNYAYSLLPTEELVLLRDGVATLNPDDATQTDLARDIEARITEEIDFRVRLRTQSAHTADMVQPGPRCRHPERCEGLSHCREEYACDD